MMVAIEIQFQNASNPIIRGNWLHLCVNIYSHPCSSCGFHCYYFVQLASQYLLLELTIWFLDAWIVATKLLRSGHVTLM